MNPNYTTLKLLLCPEKNKDALNLHIWLEADFENKWRPLRHSREYRAFHVPDDMKQKIKILDGGSIRFDVSNLHSIPIRLFSGQITQRPFGSEAPGISSIADFDLNPKKLISILIDLPYEKFDIISREINRALDQEYYIEAQVTLKNNSDENTPVIVDSVSFAAPALFF